LLLFFIWQLDRMLRMRLVLIRLVLAWRRTMGMLGMGRVAWGLARMLGILIGGWMRFAHVQLL
jgi:hypothetical protein